MPNDLEKGVLYGVLGIALVLQNTQGNPFQPPVVLLVDGA